MEHVRGDLVSLAKQGHIKGHIMHGCNAQGIMGAGIAYQLKREFPQCFEVYREHYKGGIPLLGHAIPAQIHQDMVIWNLITQFTFGRDRNTRYVNYSAVDEAMRDMRDRIDKENNPSIPREVHFPLIGCGLANGEWDVISEIIERNFEGFRKVLYTL